MTAAVNIGWSSYLSYEGPFYGGTQKFVLSPNPTDNQKLLAVITSTEGGHFDAINMYDRMIVSVGLIQWGEAGQFAVSDMLGQVMKVSPDLLAPLQPALDQAGAAFTKDPKGNYRFFFKDARGEVLSQQEEHQLFYLHADGTKGSWDDPSKTYAKTWAACIANVFQQPAAIQAQVDFTVPRLRWFATSAAQAVLWGSGDPTDNTGWCGALRAGFISFAANLPAVASAHLIKAINSLTGTPKWSEDWCVAILKELTFGPNIAIYPGRYNAIRPTIEKLYGVNLPDFSSDLKAWAAQNNVDPAASPNFLSIAQVQSELISEGYDIGPSGADGVDGPKTRDAIMRFQGLHGLQQDGVVGPKTSAAFLAEYMKRNVTSS